LRLRPLAFATFLVWRLRIGACGVALVVFGAYDSYPEKMVTMFKLIEALLVENM